MNAIRTLLWLGVIASVVISACNYTVGECYPRGEGASYSTEGVGSGGGIIIPTGVGGFGEAPPKQPQSGTSQSIECNSDESNEPESECNAGDAVSDGTTFTICTEACKAPCETGVNGYSASLFKFATVVADDGTGKAGGWQQASVVLRVARWTSWTPESWSCPQMTIGMPLRNELQGKISAEMAASVSAQLATQVSGELKDIPQGVFCFRLKEEMNNRIGKIIFGATVKSP